MKAVGLYGSRDIRIGEVEKPSIGPKELLMEIKAATTCGTDYKTYTRGGYRGIDLPIIPWGHEGAGLVAEVGGEVKEFEEGQRIVAHNTAPCFRCFYCKRGQYEFCENLLLKWGTYAEYNRIPAPIVELNTFKIPSHVSFEQASLLEPLSCAVYGAEELGIGLTDKVAIIGAGAQGLFYVQLAKLYGAEKVISIDLVDFRLNKAKELGATDTINAAEEDVEERVRGLTDGRGCEIAIEAVGIPETWEQAVRLVRKGGTVLEYGGTEAEKSFTISTEKVHYGGLDIKGVFHTRPQYVRKAWDLIMSGNIDTESIITSKMSLDDAAKAYSILDGSKNEIKIALVP